MLDNAYKIETPEGVWLHLNIAGPISRGIALLIDSLIYIATVILLSIFNSIVQMAVGRDIAEGIFLIVLFFLAWFYFVAFEMWNRGRSIGKMVMNLQVICDDGTPITWKASMLRNLLRTADFLPIMNGFGFLSCLMSRRFKRIGDLAAGTLVIYNNERIKPTAEFDVEKPEAPEQAYTSEEQRGVVAFGERARFLGQARAEELANHLAPILGCSDGTAVHKLLRQAAWLMGRRP